MRYDQTKFCGYTCYIDFTMLESLRESLETWQNLGKPHMFMTLPRHQEIAVRHFWCQQMWPLEPHDNGICTTPSTKACHVSCDLSEQESIPFQSNSACSETLEEKGRDAQNR